MPADLSRPGLAVSIQALDAVLGEDLDTAETQAAGCTTRAADTPGSPIVSKIKP